MSEKTISFSAVDSWFFRESRPMDATGESQSIFPPGIRTVSGAIRTWIGEQEHVDWNDFKTNANNPLRSKIGSSKEGDLGALKFKGVWLNKQGRRLYPSPLNLMKKEGQLYQLKLAEKGIRCDLGKNIRLPEFPSEEARGSKPLEDTWIDEEALISILKGETVSFEDKHFFVSERLYHKESRIGIARDNIKRTVKEGLLYQTQHIRPERGIKLEIDISGLPVSCNSGHALVRLGGESRLATLVVNEKYAALPQINIGNAEQEQAHGIIIYLLSPLQMQYEQYKTHPLPGFTYKEQTGQTSYWEGSIENIPLKLHGAITGKSIRDGGWNMAKHRPRTDKSLIPAGSLFFCEVVSTDIADTIRKLHGSQVGELQQYGYGHMAVGIWKKG